MMNVLKRSKVGDCCTSNCDGLTCGAPIANTISQDLIVVARYIVDQAAYSYVEIQVSAKIYYSEKSSRLGYKCMPRWKHPKKYLAVQKTHTTTRSCAVDILMDRTGPSCAISNVPR